MAPRAVSRGEPRSKASAPRWPVHHRAGLARDECLGSVARQMVRYEPLDAAAAGAPGARWGHAPVRPSLCRLGRA